MKTSLGVRMKRYESQSRVYLEAKLPVIIRIDGKGFSKYTKGFKKPFDKIFMETMFETTKFLCSKLPGSLHSIRWDNFIVSWLHQW